MILETEKTRVVDNSHRLEYQKAVLVEYGSVAFLTAGTGGSKCDVDGSGVVVSPTGKDRCDA